MLKYQLTEAPEESLQQFYNQTESGWVLKVEGVVPQTKFQEVESKVKEFRENNILLKQQLETITKTPLNNTDPKQLNVNEILENHVKEMKLNYEAKVSELSADREKLSAQLERVVLSDTVKTVAGEYGVLPTAIEDVLSRAKENFTVQDGQAVSRESKVDKNGNPYTIKSWMESLSESAPHLFAGSRGSGANKPLKSVNLHGGSKTPSEMIAKGLAKLRA